MHHVFVHSKDSLGLWGPPLDIPLPVDVTGPAVDAASVGPNPSNGVLADKSHPGNLVVSAQITDKDAGGQRRATWPTPRRSSTRRIRTRPGNRSATAAVDGRLDSTSEAVYGLIPLSQVKALPTARITSTCVDRMPPGTGARCTR